MRQEHECCRNCEGRDVKGFCEDIMEPLLRDWHLEGVGSIHMPDNGFCKMFRPSEEFLAEEAAAERDADETMGKRPPVGSLIGERVGVTR
jgi:hypothetical protein